MAYMFVMATTAPDAGRAWMEGMKVNENFEKIKGRLGGRGEADLREPGTAGDAEL